MEEQIIIFIVLLSFVIIIVGVILTPLKIKYRKRKLEILNKCLSEKNVSKIKEEKTIELLLSYREKYESYANKWYYNNLLFFFLRNRKINKIVKKYNLDLN